MATDNYAVSSGGDDWQQGDSGYIDDGQILYAVNDDPELIVDVVYANIDTSPLGTDTVTAARLYWYHANYTKSKGATYRREISVGGTPIMADTGTPAAAGWHYHDLEAGELGSLNHTGVTQIAFGVGYPGVGLYRIWGIRAYEYPTAGAYAIYLSVTHAPAGGPTKTMILGV